MTVASETSRSGPYNGNGSTTVFAYGFRILDEDHLTVISRSAAGVETTLTIATHYTVSGVGSPSGGNVTMLTAPVTGSTLTILRNVPFTQEIDLENQGAYYAESVEAGFDAAVMRDQQLGERIDRAVLLPASSNIADLDALVADITRLADSADEIDTVSTNISSVVTVAPHAADITTNLADIVTVADNIADVVTVADNISSVNNVAPHAAAITTNLADITNFADVYLGAKTTDPTLRNDGTALQAGDMYFNTTVDLMKAYSGSAWVSASDVVLNVVAKAFTGNGVLTTFTLDVDPGTVNNLFVDIGGVPQRPGVDYTISGTTLTISPAVANGVPIFTRVLFSVSNIAVPADASVTAAKLDAALTADLAGKVAASGGTMTADPTAALGVATKQFVENKGTLYGHRSKIIDPNFDFWTATSSTASGYVTSTMSQDNHVGATKTASQQLHTLGQTAVPGEPTYFHRTVVSGAGSASTDFCNKVWNLESVRTLAGKTATITIWGKSDAARNMAIDLAQYFGSGGSPSGTVSGIGARQVSLTTGFQKISFTVNIPSISGKTLGTNNNDFLALTLWFSAGTANAFRTASLPLQTGTFDISRISIVEGDATGEADPTSVRHPAIEQYLVTDMFETGSGFMQSPVAAAHGATIPYRTKKRRTPVRQFTNITYGSSSGLTDQSALGTFSALDGLAVSFTASTATGYVTFNWSADQRL